MERLQMFREKMLRWGFRPFFYTTDNFFNSKNWPEFYVRPWLMHCHKMKTLLADDDSLWKLDPPSLDDVQPYELEHLKMMTDDFSLQFLLNDTMYGQLFYGFVCDCPVIIKTWEFLFPEKPCYEHHPLRFCNELELLIDEIPHPNLMRLHGFCFKHKLAIVYDEKPTHFLTKKLRSGANFGWDARMKVASQLADLFTWLHEMKMAFGCVRTSTIMIDKDFNIKVFDFGLLAHVDENDSVNGDYLLYINAPETKTDRIRTLKSDVFTFGVVLVELIAEPEHLCSVYDWICCGYNRDITPIMDMSLEANVQQRTSFNRIVEECLEEDPKKRPDMMSVRSALFRLLNKYWD